MQDFLSFSVNFFFLNQLFLSINWLVNGSLSYRLCNQLSRDGFPKPLLSQPTSANVRHWHLSFFFPLPLDISGFWDCRAQQGSKSSTTWRSLVLPNISLHKSGLCSWYFSIFSSLWESFHISGMDIIDRIDFSSLVINKTPELCLSLGFLIPFHHPVPFPCSYWPLLRFLAGMIPKVWTTSL